ncbi:glycoside hydrolase [Delphinella strobiligena]|nr:glycoside hydrolase [Delphinella strobiligena]
MLYTTLAWVLLATFSAQLTSAKTVLSHFMLQNSYAYDLQQWKTDIAAAQQIGLDGFALNWLPPDCSSPGLDWQVARIDDAFTAAEDMGFNLIFSFDMSYSVCDTYWNVTFMESMITKYAGSSAALRWNTNLVVSTYGGDTVKEYGNEFFQSLKNSLKAAGSSISLVPALTSFAEAAQSSPVTSAAKLISEYTSIDGYFNSWPLSNDNLTTAADVAFKAALNVAGKTGPYMMAISPWQFKDLNDGDSANSWVSYSDTLFAQRLHAVANSLFEPDIIEVLTWNDFGESHYLRDLPSFTDTSAKDYVTYSDGMNNYVDGMNHAPWRIIAKYYIAWWKTGSAPVITGDQVVYWYRIHPKAAVCTGGASTGSIRNYEYPVDAVFAWALVKEAATISVSVGSNANWTFNANSTGPQMAMVPFPSNLDSGITPEVEILRDGSVVAHGKGSVQITADCPWQNFNPVVNLAGKGINR